MHGFFGWTADGQPAHRAVVDLTEAIRASREAMELWADTQKHPTHPPFTGGTQDSWPAWAVDALFILRVETERIRAFLASEVNRG
jgi:hypothetical protein